MQVALMLLGTTSDNDSFSTQSVKLLAVLSKVAAVIMIM